MGLFTPGWKHRDHDKAARAASRIRNQQTLFEILSDESTDAIEEPVLFQPD